MVCFSLFFQSSLEEGKANRQEQLAKSDSNNIVAPISSNAELPLARHRPDPAMKSGKLSSTDKLKNWRESFKPITKRSNRNHVITFDSQLKTALNTKTIGNDTKVHWCSCSLSSGLSSV